MPTFNWHSILPLNWISGGIDKEKEKEDDVVEIDEDLIDDSQESA